MSPNENFEFENRLIFIYDENGCDSTYWNSLDKKYAITNPNPYVILSQMIPYN